MNKPFLPNSFVVVYERDVDTAPVGFADRFAMIVYGGSFMESQQANLRIKGMIEWKGLYPYISVAKYSVDENFNMHLIYTWTNPLSKG